MVRACYEAALKDAPKLARKISIQFEIGPTGAVNTARVGDDEVHSEALSKCLVAAVKSWKFPAHLHHPTALVTYSFNFGNRASP